MNKDNAIFWIENGEIHQGKTVVLKDIDIQLNKGEFVYLIGRTGSGKSSLLKALYGELPLSIGNGKVSDFDLTKLKRKEVPFLRRKLGIVFQDFQLLMDRTVLQNLYFVLKATGWKNKQEIHDRALECLKLVSIEDQAEKMPHELSGGEQQRLSIARALLNRPKLILADEPTGNLDPETSEEIMRLLIAIAREEKTAILIATHDMHIVQKFPNRIVTVKDGLLTES